MPEAYADLHIHTYFSDGSFSPAEIVNKTHKLGFKAIAIADHDTIQGVNPAIDAAQSLNLEVISGVELSVEVNGYEIHILGYNVDLDSEPLHEKLNKFALQRKKRLDLIIKKLKDMGKELNSSKVMSFAKRGIVSRLHIAQAMVQEKIVSSTADAFKYYIGNGKPAFVGCKSVTLEGAIRLIRQAGGVPVYAHPALTKRDDLIPLMIDSGLKGIEVYHSSHQQSDIKRYTNLAKKHSLLITGGSDCHGESKKRILIGSIKLPYHFVEKLKGTSLRI